MGMKIKAFVLTVVITALVLATVARADYVIYLPTTQVPFGDPLPVTMPSGYLLPVPGTLLYPVTDPTSNTTASSAEEIATLSISTTSSYYYAYWWNYSTAYMYNNYLLGGVVGTVGLNPGSTGIRNFVAWTTFTVGEGSNYIKLVVSASSSVGIYCIGVLSNSSWTLSVVNSTSSGTSLEVYISTTFKASTYYVLLFACYATGPVTASISYGSGFTYYTSATPFSSGAYVWLMYAYNAVILNVNNPYSSSTWTALQAAYPDTAVTATNNTYSAYVERMYIMPGLVSSINTVANTGYWVSLPYTLYTINLLAVNATGYLKQASGSFSLYLGGSTTTLSASPSVSTSSFTLVASQSVPLSVTSSGHDDVVSYPLGNYTFTTTQSSLPSTNCVATVTSSSTSWNCPTASSGIWANVGSLSTIYVGIGGYAYGSTFSYTYKNSTNILKSNVTSLSTSSGTAQTLYYLASSYGSFTVPANFNPWYSTLPVAIGTQLATISWSGYLELPALYVNGTSIPLTPNTFFLVTSGDQESISTSQTAPGAVQFTSNSAGNAGEYFQLPQCYISSNPYGGYTGTYSLLSCIAISYGGVTAVVKFYEPQGGMGVILGFQRLSYPNSLSGYFVPWIYIGTNGYLYMGDYAGGYWQLSTSISPGWHTLVFSEYYSSGTYYIQAWLDGSYIGEASTPTLPFLFGNYANSPYGYIATGYVNGWAGTPSGSGWWFFNGSISFIALYPGAPTQAEIAASSGGPLPPGYIALYTAGSYSPSADVWFDASGNGNNAVGGYSSGFAPPSIVAPAYLTYFTSYSFTYNAYPAHNTTVNVYFNGTLYYGRAFYVNASIPALPYILLNPIGQSPYLSITVGSATFSTYPTMYLYFGSDVEGSTVSISVQNAFYTDVGSSTLSVSVPTSGGFFKSLVGPIGLTTKNQQIVYVGPSTSPSVTTEIILVTPGGGNITVGVNGISSLTFTVGSSKYTYTLARPAQVIYSNASLILQSVTYSSDNNVVYYPFLNTTTLTGGGAYYLIAPTGSSAYVGPGILTTVPSIPGIQPYNPSVGYVTASTAAVRLFNLTGFLVGSSTFSSFSVLYLYPEVTLLYINATLIFPNFIPEYGIVGFYVSTVPKTPVGIYVTTTQTAASQWPNQVLMGILSSYSGSWLWVNASMYAGLSPGVYSYDEVDVYANLVNTPVGFAFYDPSTNIWASETTNLSPQTYIVLGTFGNTLIKTLITIGYTATAASPPPLILPTFNSMLAIGSSGFSQLILTGSIIALFMMLANRFRDTATAGIVVGATATALGVLISAPPMIGVGVILMVAAIGYKYIKK